MPTIALKPKRAKKTKNINKPKRKTSTALAPMRPTHIPQALVHAVCGLTDPFCGHAFGAKYPDDSSLRSLSFTDHHSVTGGSFSGTGALLLAPDYNVLPWIFPASITGGTATWASFVSNPNANNNVVDFRITSWGVRVSSIAAPLTATGMVRFRSLASDSILPTTDCLSYARSGSLDVPLQDCKDITIIGPHTADMPQKWYSNGTAAGSAASTWRSPGFSPITLFFDGCPDGSVVNVEVIVHYELQFASSSGMTLFSTPSPMANPVVTGAAAKVTSKTKTFAKKAAAKVGQEIKEQATKAIVSEIKGVLAPENAILNVAREVN